MNEIPTEQDLQFLAFAKAHRPCWFRQFERLQARDAKNAEKAKATVPDEV
jgi:hypothetical protein